MDEQTKQLLAQVVEKVDRLLEGVASLRSNVDGLRLNVDMMRLQIDRREQFNPTSTAVRSTCINCGISMLSKNLSRHLKTCPGTVKTNNSFDINQPGPSSANMGRRPSTTESESDTPEPQPPPVKRGRPPGRGRGRKL